MEKQPHAKIESQHSKYSNHRIIIFMRAVNYNNINEKSPNICLINNFAELLIKVR